MSFKLYVHIKINKDILLLKSFINFSIDEKILKRLS